MKHPDRIVRFPGSLSDLATETGDLRYDCLALFLAALSTKIAVDGDADAARGRPRLAASLHGAAAALAEARAHIDEAWRISAPHMDDTASSAAARRGSTS